MLSQLKCSKKISVRGAYGRRIVVTAKFERGYPRCPRARGEREGGRSERNEGMRRERKEKEKYGALNPSSCTGDRGAVAGFTCGTNKSKSEFRADRMPQNACSLTRELDSILVWVSPQNACSLTRELRAQEVLTTVYKRNECAYCKVGYSTDDK